MKREDVACIDYNNCRTEIHPTLNGVLVVMDYTKTQTEPGFILNLDRDFESILSNDKYFSVMRENFIPFITVSCIGELDTSGKVAAPCEVHNQKLGSREYALTFSGSKRPKSRIAFEINMQETKLFQDTTVESKHAEINNAFGGIAFLGESREFGEQWLYSRIELSNISPLQGKRIRKTFLHIPNVGPYGAQLTVNRISARFCSFGSNWQNKIAISEPVAESTLSNGYYHLDMTNLLGNMRKKSENFVIRARTSSKGAVIPTGDNFCFPQILEVQFQ